MSLIHFDDRFALVREPAGSRFRARLAEVGRISQEFVAMRRTSGAPSSKGILSAAGLPGLIESLEYCVDIHYEEKSSRFAFTFEGIDSNLYSLSIAALPDGFDVFANSVSLSYFRYEKPPRVEPHYQGTADFVEHFAVESPEAEQAYLQGLRRIAARIRTNQSGAIPTASFAERSLAIASPVQTAKTLDWTNLATWDAGLFAYTAGLMGAAAMMAQGAGPGWLGFLVAFVPASMLAAWAVAPHA